MASHLPLDPPATADEHYFTLAELRAEQDIVPYGDSAIEPNRELAEQVIERACGVAFIPRRRIEVSTIGASGRIYLLQPKVRVIEAVNDGNDWTSEQVLALAGSLRGVQWAPGTQVTVTYTHGYDAPPLRIRRAAMLATRVWTTKGPVDDRATQIATDGATINLATPGVLGSVTGIPEVDAAIAQHDHRALVA